VTPPQKLSSTSHLIFCHRFQFEDGFDGGALEVSTDGGATWVDVVAGGGSFVSGGYNGSISGSFGSPIASRPAWTGGDATAAMTRVEVDLGAFAGLDRLVRFRLAADRLAVGSQPGVGWFVDDIQFTNTLAEAPCPTPTPTPTPGPKTIGPNGPVSPWNGTWNGALVSPGGVTEEDTCVDGVNCETFTFTVGGTKDDWIAANERVQVRLNWQNSSNEYDLYLHQGSDTSGPLVTSSIQGPGLTHQVAFIDVAQVGTGVFTVHVAYDVTATSAADPYLGVVSAVPETFPTAPAAPQDNGPKIGYENFEAPGVLTPVTTTSAGGQVHSVEYLGRGAGRTVDR